MNYFDGMLGGSWYKKHPSGLLAMGGVFTIQGSSTVQKIQVDYPIAFPGKCTGIWFTFHTEDPSTRSCGIYDLTELGHCIASIKCSTSNAIRFHAVGY